MYMGQIITLDADSNKIYLGEGEHLPSLCNGLFKAIVLCGENQACSQEEANRPDPFLIGKHNQLANNSTFCTIIKLKHSPVPGDNWRHATPSDRPSRCYCHRNRDTPNRSDPASSFLAVQADVCVPAPVLATHAWHRTFRGPVHTKWITAMEMD